MDIEDLKVLMGHNSVKTTEIYGEMQLNPEMHEKYEEQCKTPSTEKPEVGLGGTVIV